MMSCAWRKWGTPLALGLALVCAADETALAQFYFRPFVHTFRYDLPPPDIEDDYDAPRFASRRAVARILAREGFQLVGPLGRRGDQLVATGVSRREGETRFFIDPFEGVIIHAVSLGGPPPRRDDGFAPQFGGSRPAVKEVGRDRAQPPEEARESGGARIRSVARPAPQSNTPATLPAPSAPLAAPAPRAAPKQPPARPVETAKPTEPPKPIEWAKPAEISKPAEPPTSTAAGGADAPKPVEAPKPVAAAAPKPVETAPATKPTTAPVAPQPREARGPTPPERAPAQTAARAEPQRAVPLPPPPVPSVSPPSSVGAKPVAAAKAPPVKATALRSTGASSYRAIVPPKATEGTTVVTPAARATTTGPAIAGAKTPQGVAMPRTSN